MKTFHCDHCHQQVFFENVSCESCGHKLGFLQDLGEVSTFEPDGHGSWRSLDPHAHGRSYKPCRNYAIEQVCNRMIRADDPEALCDSCRLTRVIPNLQDEPNRARWYKLERAKRRMLYTLKTLELPLRSRQQDPATGLTFEFLQVTADSPLVHTGHNNGVITINVAEADDDYRARTRSQMDERYRTVLGHFRHEIGHYYFLHLMGEGPLLEACRALFGDERGDYGEALQRHYEQGPPEHWEDHYISAYATMHPFEDWAETWAHYLHMFDTLETANACGMALNPDNRREPSMDPDASAQITHAFDDMIERWFALTYALNSLNRSMGLADAYPFTLPTPVIEKLRFVHRVIRGCAHH